MISKELKSQLSILKETNPEYIQTQFYRRRGIYESINRYKNPN